MSELRSFIIGFGSAAIVLVLGHLANDPDIWYPPDKPSVIIVDSDERQDAGAFVIRPPVVGVTEPVSQANTIGIVTALRSLTTATPVLAATSVLQSTQSQIASTPTTVIPTPIASPSLPEATVPPTTQPEPTVETPTVTPTPLPPTPTPPGNSGEHRIIPSVLEPVTDVVGGLLP